MVFGRKPQYVHTPYVAPPAQPQAAAPSVDQAIHNAEMRTGNMDARISALDAEIAGYKRDMQRHPQGSSSYNMSKRRALHAMRQRKSLESRASMAANAAFNLGQVRDARYQQEDNIAMVQGIKAANADIRHAQQHVDLDEVEDLQDEMQEALEEVNEVGNMLGRTYDVDNVDETEFEAELDQLEQESVGYGQQHAAPTPSYLQPSAMPSVPTATPSHPGPRPAASHRPPSAYPHQTPANRY